MDRLDQLPGLDDFLSALRFAGVPIGPYELVWLRHAFRLEPSLDRQGLKDLLACTLIKQESHREAFESLFTDWCPVEETGIPEPPDGKSTQAQDEKSEPSNSSTETPLRPTPRNDRPQSLEKPRQRIIRSILATLRTFSRRWLIAALLVILSTTLVYVLWLPQSPVVTPLIDGPVIPPPVPLRETALPSNPAPEFWTWVPEFTIHTPSLLDSVWAAGTLALLSGLTGLLLWWWYRRRSQLPSQETPSRPGPACVPLSSGKTTLTEFIDREALRTTVWGVERFVSEDELPAVDVDRTVAATARAGGLPIIRYQHAVYPREVWLWHDVMVQDPTIHRILRELEGSLARAGLPVRVGRFAETPTLIGWREGQEFSPLVLEGHRQSALVAILTDGYGIRLAAQSVLDAMPLTQVLKAFGEWPRLTFVDVAEGKHGLAQSVHAYGVRCIAPQDIPAFLAASAVTATASRRRESELFGDLRVWAAATTLSPDPITEERAFALRQRLGLDLSPWQFRDLLRESESSGDRMTWSAKSRAMHLNWLAQCSVQGNVVPDGSPLAQALEYWIAQYQEEITHREQHENALLPWKHTQAEQRLRMEIAFLQLWLQPKEAIEKLYGLYGNLKEEIHERLSMFTDWDGHDNGRASVPSLPRRRESTEQAASTIALPWKESELPTLTRWMLAAMGFGGRREQEPAPLRMPIKLSLALGVCAGLTVVALGTALWRLLAPVTPVFRPAVPEAFQTIRIQDAQRSGVNNFRIAIGTPKVLGTETVPAQSVIDVRWKWQPSLPDRPNVEKFGKSELWHAGVLPQAIRGCEEGPNQEKWPRRSLVVIHAEPSDIPARQLAIQLLDRGSADLVLLGTDWATYLDKLIQVDASLTKDDQLVLILPSNAEVPKSAFQGVVGVVQSTDFNTLITRLNFSGVKLLAEKWGTVQTTGTPLLRGGPTGRRNEKTGVTFVTVCGGTFTMGSDKKTVTEEDLDETPPHSVTLSTFEISKTEITNAQYQLFQKDHEKNDNWPVTNVDWNKAKAFCENFDYALPTEAEWEYAARGGSTTQWSFGDEEKDLGNYAWFSGNSGLREHDVGTKEPNPLGLSDMHGNVWEWVEDCYDEQAYRDRDEQVTNPLTNPLVSPNVAGVCPSFHRVLRGGSWNYSPRSLRSADRLRDDLVYRDFNIGFRCVRRPRR